MSIPILLLLLDVTSVVSAVGFAFFAFKMIIHMRWGRFERSWKFLLGGAISLAIGFIALSIEDFYPAYSFSYTLSDYLGTAASTVGVILLLLGFREHYNVWILKDLRKKEKQTAISE